MELWLKYKLQSHCQPFRPCVKAAVEGAAKEPQYPISYLAGPKIVLKGFATRPKLRFCQQRSEKIKQISCKKGNKTSGCDVVCEATLNW